MFRCSKSFRLLSTQLSILLCLQQFMLLPVQHFGNKYNVKGVILVKLCIPDIALTTILFFSKSKTGMLLVTFCGSFRMGYNENYSNWLYILFLVNRTWVLYADATSALICASLWSFSMHCIYISHVSFKWHEMCSEMLMALTLKGENKC